MNDIEKLFFKDKTRVLKSDKWVHYLDIYDKHFSKFRNKSPTILEIGVQRGGSLEIWDRYFGEGCTIYGMDIDSNCINIPIILKKDNIKIIIGDQENEYFLKEIIKQVPKFDIILDDGGHKMKQQIVSFETLYEHMNPEGVYMCEDTHTSYWPEYGGGLRNSNSFIEYSKKFIDLLHSYHIQTHPFSHTFRNTTKSVTYYDSVVVLDKFKESDNFKGPHNEIN